MGYEKPKRGDTLSLKEQKPGFSIEGIYQGSKEIDSTFGKSMLYQFASLEEEKPFSVWGFGHLDYSMANVQSGQRVKITYMGKSSQINKFKKYPHQAEVVVWKDDSTVQF